MNFGRNLKVLMAHKGITARQLSRMTGLSPMLISSIVTGRTKQPRIKTIDSLARALSVQPNDFFRDDLVRL